MRPQGFYFPDLIVIVTRFWLCFLVFTFGWDSEKKALYTWMHTKCLLKCVSEKYLTCVSPVIFEIEMYMCVSPVIFFSVYIWLRFWEKSFVYMDAHQVFAEMCEWKVSYVCITSDIWNWNVYVYHQWYFDADLNETCAKNSLIKRKNQQQVQLSLKKAQHLHKQIEEAQTHVISQVPPSPQLIQQIEESWHTCDITSDITCDITGGITCDITCDIKGAPESICD